MVPVHDHQESKDVVCKEVRRADQRHWESGRPNDLESSVHSAEIYHKKAPKRKVRFSIPDGEEEAAIVTPDSKKRKTKPIAPEAQEVDSAGTFPIKAWAKNYCKSVIGCDTHYPWDGDSDPSDLSDSDSGSEEPEVELVEAHAEDEGGESQSSGKGNNAGAAAKGLKDMQGAQAEGEKIVVHHMPEGGRPVAKRAEVAGRSSDDERID